MTASARRVRPWSWAGPCPAAGRGQVTGNGFLRARPEPRLPWNVPGPVRAQRAPPTCSPAAVDVAPGALLAGVGLGAAGAVVPGQGLRDAGIPGGLCETECGPRGGGTRESWA